MENTQYLERVNKLKDTYSSAEKYSKKQWPEDLSYNGYEAIKTIVEEM